MKAFFLSKMNPTSFEGLLKLALSVVVLTLGLGLSEVSAQNSGVLISDDVSATTPNTRSLLDIRLQSGATDGKGFLMPRVTRVQRENMTGLGTALTASTNRGMMVYQYDEDLVNFPLAPRGFYHWNGSSWIRMLDASAGGWLTAGNVGTTPASQFIGTTDDVGFRVRTNDIERIRVSGGNATTGGNVGIGVTANAEERLQVNGNILLSRGGAREITVQDASGNSDPGNSLTVRAGNPLGFNSAAGGHLILEAGSGYSGFSAKGGNVVVRSGGNDFATAAINNGHIIFETGRENLAETIKERMRIRADGIVHIGAYNAALPGHSAGQLLYVAGKVRSNGVNETSDKRLKKNFQPIGSALNKVLSMNGVTYEWRIEEFPDRNFVEGTQYGMVAQDLEQVIPELVDTDSDGWKSIEYSHIVPVLIEAIKDQQAIIDNQNDEISALKGVKEELDVLKASVELISEHIRTSQK